MVACVEPTPLGLDLSDRILPRPLIGLYCFGVFSCDPDGFDGVTVADRGLYIGKTSGRSQTVHVSGTVKTDIDRVLAGVRGDFERLAQAGEIELQASAAEQPILTRK